MFCPSCGCELRENDRFCPGCGAKVLPAGATDQPAAAPTREYGKEPTREYAPADAAAPERILPEEEDEHTVVIDGFAGPSFAQNDYAEPLYSRRPEPHNDIPQQQQPKSYQDSFIQHEKPRFEENVWQDPRRSSRKPVPRQTAGKKALSVILCLLMMLFGSWTMTICAARLALSESNVRAAYDKGTIADLKISTSEGEKPLARVLMDNVVDADTNSIIPLEETAVNEFLRSDRVNTFTENLAVDFTQFFIFGRQPTLLNSTEITGFLTDISEDIYNKINYSMSDADIAQIGQRIDGGDMSFLSIDENGNYFKQKYHVDPYMISSLFSVAALAICFGLTLVCMVLIFVINRGNAAAGFGFNGTALTVIGVINLLLAAAMLIFSFIKPIFLVSDLLRYLAFSTGGISIGVLIVGIVFSVLKSAFRNRIR